MSRKQLLDPLLDLLVGQLARVVVGQHLAHVHAVTLVDLTDEMLELHRELAVTDRQLRHAPRDLADGVAKDLDRDLGLAQSLPRLLVVRSCGAEVLVRLHRGADRVAEPGARRQDLRCENALLSGTLEHVAAQSSFAIVELVDRS